MIWQQPWAWAAAAAVLLPVIIHLLGFGRAPRFRFPTLRFVQSSRLLPTRRTRIHDPWLLLLRAMIVLAAVAALAQPLIQTAERRARFAASLARVVILDTSASAQRATARAGWSTDSARVLSQLLADSADVARVLETADVETALAGAAYWLRTHALRREIVVLSDFQVGTLDDAAVRDVPVEIGVLPVRLGAFGSAERIAVALDSVRATPLLFTASVEASRANAALEAARRTSAVASSANELARVDRLGSVAIVAADYPSRDSLLANTVPLQTPWMIRLLHELRSHPLLVGERTVRTLQGTHNGQPLLLLLLPTDATPGSVLSVAAALYDVIARLDDQGALLSRTSALIELETSTLSDSVLRDWARAPASEPVVSDVQRSAVANRAMSAEPSGLFDAASDAPWLWALVLALLGVESVVRGRMVRSAGANGDPDVALDGATNGATDGQTDGATDGQTDGATDGLMDGVSDGVTDGATTRARVA